MDQSVNGGGGAIPWAVTKTGVFFVWKREKDAECSETEKYAKIFVTFLQGYPLKTFPPIFSWNIEIFPEILQFLPSEAGGGP